MRERLSCKDFWSFLYKDRDYSGPLHLGELELESRVCAFEDSVGRDVLQEGWRRRMGKDRTPDSSGPGHSELDSGGGTLGEPRVLGAMGRGS